MVNILSLFIYLILICILYHVKAHTIFLAQNMVPYIHLIILIIVCPAQRLDLLIFGNKNPRPKGCGWGLVGIMMNTFARIEGADHQNMIT